MKLAALMQQATETVAATQRRLPAPIRALAEKVPVFFEEFPSDEIVGDDVEPDILGLFNGDAHDVAAGEQSFPPQIFLYLGNIWDFVEGDPSAFRDEVRLTYLHELGHYLGWDENEVARRGLE